MLDKVLYTEGDLSYLNISDDHRDRLVERMLLLEEEFINDYK